MNNKKSWKKYTSQSRRDEYYTPDNAASIILPYLPRGKVIWECAWGQGHLARYLRSQGHKVVGSPDHDFLTDSPFKSDIIVTNPPFSRKDEFLERAYALGRPFAMVLPVDALVSVARYQLFHRYGLQLLIPSRRIQFISEIATSNSCSFGSIWCCWRLLPQDLIFVDMPRQSTGTEVA